MRFRLKTAQPFAPMPVERGFRPTGSLGADYARTAGRDYKAAVAPARVSKATEAGKGATTLSFTVASERRMAGFFGDLILRCSRANVDLERLYAGLLALAKDHDVSQLLGKVTGLTFMGDKSIPGLGDPP